MPEDCRVVRYEDIVLHDRASFTAIIDKATIDGFAAFSGDCNPLHTDEGYAESTPFRGRVAHGMIIPGLFSRLIGMYLPGKYSLYLSQTLQFHVPITPGTEVLIGREVVHKTDAYRTVGIRTSAIEIKTKKLLVSGEAMVKLLQ